MLAHFWFILLLGGLLRFGDFIGTTFGIRPIVATPEEYLKAILG